MWDRYDPRVRQRARDDAWDRDLGGRGSTNIRATAIAEFQRTRHDAGIANRTINMGPGRVVSSAEILWQMASAREPREELA
jgi:hypothetical protein